MFESFWKLSKMQDSLLFQKCRIKWLREGDCNSSYFHASVNNRMRINATHGIRVEGNWVVEPERVKEGIHKHFEVIFNQNDWMRPTLDGINFRKLSEIESLSLMASFSPEEVKQEV